MDTKNFTIKSQEAIQKAQELAILGQQQAIETGHLLKAILVVDEDVISFAFKKVNTNINRMNQALEGILNNYPKITGSGSQYLSNDLQRVLVQATNFLGQF